MADSKKKSSSHTKPTTREDISVPVKSRNHEAVSKRAVPLASKTSKNTGRHTVAIKLRTSSRSSKKVKKDMERLKKSVKKSSPSKELTLDEIIKAKIASSPTKKTSAPVEDHSVTESEYFSC